MEEKLFFISDIHLGLLTPQKEKEREGELIDFLNFCQSNCTHLFILGDLFDYWFEYKRVIQKDFFRTLTALHDLVESGVEVHYFIGNHDFLHKNFFKDRVGVNLHPDPVEFSIAGKKFYLGHGDGLVSNDTGYRILKKILRNRFLQMMYSLVHPDLGIWIASRTSKTSRNYTDKKHYGYVDGLFEYAKEQINNGADYVIFGHSHVRTVKEYNGAKYINLGAWLQNPVYGVFQDNNFEIIEWKK